MLKYGERERRSTPKMKYDLLIEYSKNKLISEHEYNERIDSQTSLLVWNLFCLTDGKRYSVLGSNVTQSSSSHLRCSSSGLNHLTHDLIARNREG